MKASEACTHPGTSASSSSSTAKTSTTTKMMMIRLSGLYDGRAIALHFEVRSRQADDNDDSIVNDAQIDDHESDEQETITTRICSIERRRTDGRTDSNGISRSSASCCCYCCCCCCCCCESRNLHRKL